MNTEKHSSNIKIKSSPQHIKIFVNNKIIADTIKPVWVQESGKPGIYFLPYESIDHTLLKKSWKYFVDKLKGRARFFHILVNGKKIKNACCRFPEASGDAYMLKNYLVIFPGKVDAYYVNGELANDQESGILRETTIY